MTGFDSKRAMAADKIGEKHMTKDTRWERSIETFSDEQLLFELVRRNGFQRAAKKTEYFGEGWMTSIVGIGKNQSVSITMDEDDFKELSALAVVGFEAKLKEKNT